MKRVLRILICHFESAKQIGFRVLVKVTVLGGGFGGASGVKDLTGVCHVCKHLKRDNWLLGTFFREHPQYAEAVDPIAVPA